MATSYPGAYDLFDQGNPDPGSPRTSPSLAGEVSDVNDAVVTIQKVLGLNPHRSFSTVDARVKSIENDVVAVETLAADNHDTVTSLASHIAPIGTVAPFAGSQVPANWVLCDGRELNRTIFTDLFGVIGTTYGAGDGSTTFNVPDYRGRVPLGAGTLGSDSYNLGAKGGKARHALTTGELPAHTHGSVSNHSHSTSVGNQNSNHSHSGTTANDSHSHTAQSGGGHRHRTITEGTSGTVPHSHGEYDWATPTGNPQPATGIRRNGWYTTSVGDHTHGTNNDSHNHSFSTGGISASHRHSVSIGNAGGHTHSSVGSNQEHENRPPYQAVNFIIKASTLGAAEPGEPPPTWTSAITPVNSNYTIDDSGVSDRFLMVDASSNDVTITLPPVADSTGRLLTFKRVDNSAFAVTIDGADAETIDGQASMVLSVQYEDITIVCDGSAWFIIG